MLYWILKDISTLCFLNFRFLVFAFIMISQISLTVGLIRTILLITFKSFLRHVDFLHMPCECPSEGSFESTILCIALKGRLCVYLPVIPQILRIFEHPLALIAGEGGVTVNPSHVVPDVTSITKNNWTLGTFVFSYFFLALFRGQCVTVELLLM